MNTKRTGRLSLISLVGAIAFVLTFGLVLKLRAAPSDDNQAAIKSLMDTWAAALRAKDLDKLMSLYSPDVVAFDIVPPLEYKGREAYRSDFKKMFELFDGPIQTENRDLIITSGDNIGFSRYLQHLTATLKSGEKTDTWVRVTDCYQKTGGKWLVVHEHVSAPTDLESGKSVLDLKP
jgi:uncharacterized protein (TIGR02246 family)